MAHHDKYSKILGTRAPFEPIGDKQKTPSEANKARKKIAKKTGFDKFSKKEKARRIEGIRNILGN